MILGIGKYFYIKIPIPIHKNLDLYNLCENYIQNKN